MLQRSDLVDLAGGYTQLHKRGAEHSGRCPFHEERTPSFWVNGTKGVYHCFGCGASGDVISFLQAKQGLDFVEAIELLADRYRVELEYEGGGKGSGQRRQSKRRLYEVSDAAAAFYETALWSAVSAEHVREYLAQRNITPDTARAFRLGFSPEAGVLAAKAMERGFTKEELTEARLIGAKGHDFFRGRLMVPIIDRAKRVIGFGARKLREEQFGGKYINSSDGVLFHKKQTIFVSPGISDAAKASGSVLVVEGYMDVIALWQAGFRNACAVMGTALTEEQVLELKRLAPRALFAFDPDAAGQVATMRALDQARAHDLDVRVVLLPEGEDPADVIHGAGGRERMEALLEAGVPLLHYRTSMLLGSGDLGDATERDRIWREAIELFRAAPDGPARRDQIARLGNALQLDGDALQSLYEVTGAEAPMRLTRQDSWEPKFRGEREVSRRVATTAPRSTAIVREKRLLAVALRLAEREGEAAGLATTLPPAEAFGLDVHRRARTALVEGGADALAPARVRVSGDEELFELVAELATLTERDRVGAEDLGTLRETVIELSHKVELQHLERRIGELTARLGTADEIADDEALVQLAAA
ncbi:MAG: dnaG, partial [Thermoleophilia bacterium]|nr:dnaG [Thermoleophilia bacterium]